MYKDSIKIINIMIIKGTCNSNTRSELAFRLLTPLQIHVLYTCTH